MNETSKSILHIVRETIRIVCSMVFLITLWILVHHFLISPWHRQWGANSDEVRQRLPGDQMVPDPDYSCIHAITIKAPAKSVWP